MAMNDKKAKYTPGDYNVVCYNLVGKKLPYKAHGILSLREAEVAAKDFRDVLDDVHSTVIFRAISNSLVTKGNH